MPYEYHPGELEVQSRLGVTDRAARVQHSIHDRLPPAAVQFLELQPFVILGGEHAGQVWASLLGAHAGFAAAPDPRIVQVQGMLPAHDPLSGRFVSGGDVGMLWIDLQHRQRMRVNGHARPTSGGFQVEVAEAYSNCPQYITPRAMPISGAGVHGSGDPELHATATLERHHCAWIGSADTFFIATRHPRTGADVSHRGGPSGFVVVRDDGTLGWPDYQGNTMFNTLGNLVIDPRAGLLFVDFETGNTLQLTGRATIEWGEGGSRDRRVRFRVAQVVETRQGTGAARV